MVVQLTSIVSRQSTSFRKASPLSLKGPFGGMFCSLLNQFYEVRPLLPVLGLYTEVQV